MRSCMAVQRETLERSASVIPFPFPVGTRPETARLLLDAQQHGVMERIDPRDRLMLDRYFGTPATVSDIVVASGISNSQVQVRLREGLVQIRRFLPDEVRDRHPQQATRLKISRRGLKRKSSVTQAPFPIDVRRDTPDKAKVHKAAMERVSERPIIFFKSSEYLLRSYRPPRMPDQDPNGDLKPMTKRVLGLIGQGLSYEEIAPIVRLSASMVKYFIERRSLNPVINVSNPHEGLVTAIEKEMVNLEELSSGLNLSDEAVNSLSAREVEVLLADTVDNLGMNRFKIAQRLGITADALEEQRLRIYRKLGVSNKAQATVFVLAFVHKAKNEGRYPVADDLGHGKQFKEYEVMDAPADIQYVIEELDRTGLAAYDKQAFLAHYLWLSGRDTAFKLIEKYLHLSDRRTIASLFNRITYGGNDPRYTMPLLDVYQKFFASIELSRAIFYDLVGEKTLERFRALVSVSRKRVRSDRAEKSVTSTKVAINKEAQGIVDQRRLSLEEVVVFG